MQKLFHALAAIVSFVSVFTGFSVSPVIAQDHSAGDGQEAPAAAQPSLVDPHAVVVSPGVTRDNVDVKDQPLIIQGDVKGSVHAVNSRVTLMPGAKIEGDFSITGGSLSVISGSSGLISAGRPHRSAVPAAAPGEKKKGDWVGGQFCLFLLGLAGGAIVLLTAPIAAQRVSETVSMRPGRSFTAGGISAAVIFAALAISGMIMHAKNIVSLIWMPFTIAIAVASLFLLVFGWLAGMRRVGDLIARRMGQTGGGSFYGRTVLGLTTFFLANSILGLINPTLGGVGLLLEFAVALMGIGALVQSTFGRDDTSLGHRFGGFSGSDLG
jgi:hypothetical protein